MSLLFKGTSTTTRADKIASFQSTSCDFGTALPIAYGTCKLAPNLINYQDFTTKEIRTTTKTGKSKSTQIDYKYYVYAELGLCEGIIDGIGKVWVGDTCYSSLASLNAGENEGAALTLNTGSNSSPTTYMSTKHPDIACGYNNMAYLYGTVYLGTNSASMPSYNVEVKGSLRSTGDGTDANPADIIIDLLDRVGLKDYADSTSFANYRKYCKEADLLMSTPPDVFSSQSKVQDIIKTILALTNAYMFWSVDRYKIVPRDDQARGDWTPNRTICYDLTTDDLIQQSGGACISFTRKDTSEMYNRFGVTFVNRDGNDYEEETVFFENASSIASNGLNAASTVDGKWFYSKARAIKCAEMQARINATELIEYTFKLDWAFERLEPGDLVTLTDDAIGLNKQPVMVESITFDKYGRPTVKAIWREPGSYSAAAYDVHTVDYNYINLNVEPGSTSAPLFIIPPADLVTSANGLEIWIALHGEADTWGGCNVYVSDQDSEYTFQGTQPVSSIYGTITTAMTATSTSVSVKFSNPKTVEILTGSALDADNGNTRIWINGECMSYTLATLTAPNTYTLSGLIRGQYGTAAAAHSVDDAVAVLDGSIFVVPLTKHYKGRTLYFKFPAFNAFQGRNENLTDLDYYTCVANTADLPNCTSVSAYNKYRELADDVTRYDIVVEWTPPDFSSYQQGQVWYKTSGTQANSLGVISEGVKGTDLGLYGNWMFGGQGYNTVTIPQAVIGDTYKIAVCTEDIYGNVESPDSSSQVSILVALKSETPNTPANLGVNLTDTFNIYWDEVRNADVKYYEVRLDASVGQETVNLLARTTEHNFNTNAVESRTGTVYVFAVSAYSKVSAPAKLTYNFPTPSAPTITCESKLAGIECKCSAIPNNCKAVHWFFDGTDSDNDIVTDGITYFYNANAGVYEISACYVDYFGDGTVSGSTMVTIAAYIDDSLIKAEAITADKLSKANQEALALANSAVQQATLTENYYNKTETSSKITEVMVDKSLLDSSGNVNVYTKTQTSSAITTALTSYTTTSDLNTKLESYSTITQTSEAVGACVAKGDVISRINLGNEGTVAIEGKYVHITGDTTIDGSVITNNMLAGSISADKLNVSSLGAICATIGTIYTASSGARITISGSLLTVNDGTRDRVKLGVW